MLDPRQVARVVAGDVRDARQAPTDGAARGLQRLVHEQNDAETQPLGSPEGLRAHMRLVREAARDVFAAHGEDGMVRLRAVALAELESVARGEHVDEARRDRVLGSFPDLLEHYGVTTRGKLAAPRFVMRTLYKARWNAIVQLDPTFRLAPVELRAYHGWLALCAPEVAPADRAAALDRYARVGGTRVGEARAVLAWQAADFDRADELFGAAYLATGSVRMRDHQLAAEMEAR